MRSTRLVRLLPPVLSAGVILSLAPLLFEHPEQNDFRSFYVGAGAQASHQLAALFHSQVGKATLVLQFVRPPVYALILEPLSYLPFTAAYWVWVVLQTAIFLGCLYQAQTRTAKAAVACLFPPVILGITHGQDCALFLGVLVLGYIFLSRKRDFAGGMVLGLGLLKFHLFFLWPVALLIQRRWRALAGLTLTGAALAACSLALVGTEGIRNYVTLLRDPRLGAIWPDPVRHVGIEGLLANLGIYSVPLAVAISVPVAALALYAVRGGQVEYLFAIVPAASLAAAPHALYYDPALFLISLWIVMSWQDAPALQQMAMWLASPLVFISPSLARPWSAIASIGLLAFLFGVIARAIGRRSSLSDRPL